jgi:very-short-patch-repair endonuclease
MLHNKDILAPSPALAGEGRGEGVWTKRRRIASRKAKTLRQNQTETEKIIWHHLKAKRFLGCKFKRQFPIGPYFVDFVCVEEKLIIEVDGGQHNENEQDKIRTAFLERKGYDVVRFWNNEVLENIEGVIGTLSLALSRKMQERGLKEKTHGP